MEETTPDTEPTDQSEIPVEDGILDVEDYDIPVVDDDADDRFSCFIAGSTLVVRLDDPGELRIPLKMSYKTLKEMREGIPEGTDELDQLVFLLERIGDEALVRKLTEETDLADATAVAVLFFRAWRQRTQVSLGKLRRSSRR